MLYTDNVNRLIFWVLIPLVLFSFISFRIIEWQIFKDGGRKEIAQQHLENLRNLKDINCLILGGSNSFFSLSAEQMSRNDEFNCYNLSLINEGYSDESYFAYVKSMPIKQIEIAHVFYSTAYLLADDKVFAERLKNNANKIGISGDSSFRLFGGSLALRLKNFLEGKPFSPSYLLYPNPNERGDFNFELYDGCDPERINNSWSLTTKQDELKNWIKSNLLRIKNLFPNAEVYLVLPSKLANSLNKANLANLSNYLQAQANDQSFRYIEQSLFSNTDELCFGFQHANQIGRKKRTTELLDLIHSE